MSIVVYVSFFYLSISCSPSHKRPTTPSYVVSIIEQYCESITVIEKGIIVYDVVHWVNYTDVSLNKNLSFPLINSSWHLECELGYIPDSNSSIDCVFNSTTPEPVWNATFPLCSE